VEIRKKTFSGKSYAGNESFFKELRGLLKWPGLPVLSLRSAGGGEDTVGRDLCEKWKKKKKKGCGEG